MKSLNLFRPAIKALAMTMVVGSMIFLASCKNDPEPTFPAPTITVGTTEASGLPGAKVSTSVTVDSPAGGKTLNILVSPSSGGTLPAVALAGTESQAVPVEFTIPASATVGTTFVLTFSSIDLQDQNSNVGTFTVTVSDKPSKQIVEVSADITANTSWTKDKIYLLTKFIRVGTDVRPGGATSGAKPEITATATLTIEAGTVIYGKVGNPGGALIVQRGSKIIAEGTATAPIVFTSGNAPGGRKAGDWAGLVICGKAFNNGHNVGQTATVGIEELEGNYGGFHGDATNSIDDDNSGSLKYVRVEFAGYPINPNQEINGITFGSVGSGTTLDYVQVSYSNDDSYEWFGGKVNAKHLIAYKAVDDDFDTDFGFSGKVQYGLIIRDANTADQSGSNAFESDNDAGGSGNTPITDATFANVTVVGPKQSFNTSMSVQFQNVAQLRRNTKEDILNSFFTGYPQGIYIDNGLGSTPLNAETGDLKLRGNILAGVEGWGGNGFGTAMTADEQAAYGLANLPSPNANHAVAPRGMVVAAGNGVWTAGVFAFPGTGAQIPATIGGLAGVNWFVKDGQNKVMQKWSDESLKLSSTIFNPSNAAPVFLPGAGSTLLNFGTGNLTGITGFDDNAYIGAFGSTDWTATGWVNWNPQAADYSKGN